jgi:hypothetical protein
MSATKPTMTLVTSNWHGQTCFRLIPISNECVYSEGLFDPESQVLVMMSKSTKQTVHLVPKLDENGDIIPLKKPRPNGKNYKEQRLVLDTYTEYYVSNREEIAAFVNKFADNAKSFDFQAYFKDVVLDNVKEVESLSNVV